ncbi:hypothetical protein B0H13DRAFT_1932551 [Mycena leptocephala]|nr:hypothetical protein B0H13DRAFT_1932551 [Mycena leptocephala]
MSRWVGKPSQHEETGNGKKNSSTFSPVTDHDGTQMSCLRLTRTLHQLTAYARESCRECSKTTKSLDGVPEHRLTIAAVLWFIFGRHLFPVLHLLARTRFYDFPPREIFVNETDIASVANRSDVVQPLIGLNDTFDIAVTVWQLATEEEQAAQSKLLREQKKGSTISDLVFEFPPYGNASATIEAEDALLHASYAESYNRISALEKTIYSDIVFRGVRLSDVDIHANVSFTIPTEVLSVSDAPDIAPSHKYPGNLNNLRASFVLIPRSPSPLDYYERHTSWFPPAVPRPRFRSLPFPLHAPTEFYRRRTDIALESFAITIPLLEHHEVPSMCPDAMNDTNPDTHIRDLLEKHPHVVTRTHLRVVRESRLFIRSVYQNKHDMLRRFSCGQTREGLKGGGAAYCNKAYLYNINHETMLQLLVPDPDSAVEGGDGLREESAYAPYMNVLPHAIGPKDVIPVPIDRQRCAEGAPNPANRTIADHMNITWKLTYSGVTSRMFLLGEMNLMLPGRSEHNDSEYRRAHKQDIAENYGSIHGHRHHTDSHPRWRLARLVLAFLVSGLLFALNANYWVTRTSTAYMSVPGTLAIAVADFLGDVQFLWPGFWDPTRELKTTGQKVVMMLVLLGSCELPVPVLMLKAILRLRVSWRWVALPGLRRAKATHQERTSARFDARTDWRWKSAIFLGIWLSFSALNLSSRYLIAPVAPPHDALDAPLSILANQNLTDFVTALQLTGRVLQIILNYRAKLFAGQYKAAAVAGLAATLLRSAESVRWVVGPAEVSPGVSYANVIWDVTLGLYCWQAAWYSSRIPEDEDGEERTETAR